MGQIGKIVDDLLTENARLKTELAEAKAEVVKVKLDAASEWVAALREIGGGIVEMADDVEKSAAAFAAKGGG